uniref:Uncharacterized protein n=1 Tax=Lepeophtheirus salmonis TaxID=72036 RepID=A0A0K2TKA5_LEPSM
MKKFNHHKRCYSVSSVCMVGKGIAHTVHHVGLTNLLVYRRFYVNYFILQTGFPRFIEL